MAINVVPNYEYLSQTLEGAYIRKARLAVTGLTPSASNIVPHGLPAVPMSVLIEPASAGGFHETSAADATNIYITADGAGTSCNLIVEY